MKHIKNILSVSFGIVALFILETSYGQAVNKNWRPELVNALNDFKQCKTTGNGFNPCTDYIGQSLKIVYGIDDFSSSTETRYMTVSEIADLVKNTSKWTSLGPAYSQDVLTKAQDNANAKKAVVALYVNAQGVGHVVVILPGTLQPSGSWGLQVPNASSFLLIDPSNAFVDKSLSYAFTKMMMKDVQLFVRNY